MRVLLFGKLRRKKRHMPQRQKSHTFTRSVKRAKKEAFATAKAQWNLFAVFHVVKQALGVKRAFFKQHGGVFAIGKGVVANVLYAVGQGKRFYVWWNHNGACRSQRIFALYPLRAKGRWVVPIVPMLVRRGVVLHVANVCYRLALVVAWYCYVGIRWFKLYGYKRRYVI